MTSWEVEGLTSRQDGFELGPVDLELGPGAVVAVLGRSGAGKTTLLRTLAGFVAASSGAFTRDGIDLTQELPERRGLGYVPQGLGLLPHRTAEGNVSFPLEIRGRLDARARSRALLERFGLVELADRYPSRLSGGEAQRVALARALAAEPRLVLWDEPWQALDVDGRHQLSLVLEELRDVERVPVVLVTHEPALAFSVAETFLVLREGRPVFHGRPLELFARPFDRFTARFAGLANVYDVAGLADGPPGSLAAWLRLRSGPGGVAFGKPEIAAGPAAWNGVVRSVRPTPEGIELVVNVGSLPVALRAPALPALGDLPVGLSVGVQVRFDVEEKSLRPLRADRGTEADVGA
jgi:ABC-type Fe3+/spermidine/putrescine transport system ATPase subunit